MTDVIIFTSFALNKEHSKKAECAERANFQAFPEIL